MSARSPLSILIRWRSLLFAVAFLAAPASSSAAAWDHVYFPTALPENYPPGPWVRMGFSQANSVSLEAGKLCLDLGGEFGMVAWFRDSSMDPALASAEMTVEWSQDVAAAGFWSLRVGDVTLSYIEGRQLDGTEFRSLTFQGVSIDAAGSGQHVWRIVRRAVVSELWRDGTQIATAGSGSGATGSVSLSFFGNRGPVTTFRGCTSYMSYAAGAFTPTELPSPTQAAGPAGRLSTFSAGDQIAVVGNTVPMTVIVKDSSGTALPNIEVNFSTSASPVGAAGQSIESSDAATGADGKAGAVFRLGSIPADYEVLCACASCEAGTSTVTFRACGKLGTNEFRQNDVRWSTQTVGNHPPPRTIGNVGCALTSVANMVNFYNAGSPGVAQVTPPQLNQDMIAAQVYNNDDDVDWRQVPRLAVAQQLRYTGRVVITAANPLVAVRGTIDGDLLGGRPVILRAERASGSPHFMLAVGKCGNDYIIADPASPTGSSTYDPADPQLTLIRIHRYAPL